MRRRIETVRQRSVARRWFRPHVVTRNQHRAELLQRRQNAVELRFARGHHLQARERSLILLPAHPNFFQVKRTAQIHHRIKHFRQRPRVDDVPFERHLFADFLHLLLSLGHKSLTSPTPTAHAHRSYAKRAPPSLLSSRPKWRDLSSCLIPPPVTIALKHVPQFKKPFRMSRISHAPPNKQRPYGRLRQKTNRHVVRKLAGIRRVVHLSKLIRPNHVHILSYKWRQRQNVVQIAGAEIVVLIAEELVRSVSAQARRPSQEKLGYANIIRAERSASLS